jgi:hypothetical protein
MLTISFLQAKKEELKKQGKYLTKAQKEAHEKQRIRNEQLLQSGVKVAALAVEGEEKAEGEEAAPVVEKKKKVVYDNRRKKVPAADKEKPVKAEEVLPETPVTPTAETEATAKSASPEPASVSTPPDDEPAKASWEESSDEEVKAAWDDESEDEETKAAKAKAKAEKEAAKEAAKKEAEKKAESSEEEDESEEESEDESEKEGENEKPAVNGGFLFQHCLCWQVLIVLYRQSCARKTAGKGTNICQTHSSKRRQGSGSVRFRGRCEPRTSISHFCRSGSRRRRQDQAS